MSATVMSFELKFLDVIMSDRFVHGWKGRPLEDPPDPILVGYDASANGDRASSDSTRAQAWYVVLSVSSDDTLHGYDTKVKAQRLNDDGTYNPEGETIEFYVDDHAGGHAIAEVTRVNRMSLVMGST